MKKFSFKKDVLSLFKSIVWPSKEKVKKELIITISGTVICTILIVIINFLTTSVLSFLI